MTTPFTVQYAALDDLTSWMSLVMLVRDNFPGLDTPEQLEDYRRTVIKNINRQTAICAKQEGLVTGILLFSTNLRLLSCMSVHPLYRRQGIATAMINQMMTAFPPDAEITVTTFREGDDKGFAPRPLYRKLGFVEGDLVEEFGYPHQRFILRRS